MNEIFSAFKEFLPIIAAGGAVISTTGLIPRFGPGRAAQIALCSRFAFKPKPESLRSAEIKLIKSMISNKNNSERYLVVTGDNGVGKTCLIDTATSMTPGVIKVRAHGDDTESDIIENALRELTGSSFNFVDKVHSAKRIVFCHRIFTLGHSPIVVINAADKKVARNLTSAVITLIDKYKLRVLVECSSNTQEKTILRTNREDVVDIKPMTKEMIWKIGQCQNLFKHTKEAGFDDIVFAVLGGVPADYEYLLDTLKFGILDDRDAKEVISSHLCTVIADAINLIMDSKLQSVDMNEILKLFDKKNMSILCDTLVVKNLKRPTHDNVFRQVQQGRVSVLIPASNAIGIVLRHNLTKKPTLDELKRLINNMQGCE